MTKIICVAGFGDDATMFDALVEAANRTSLQFVPINLPGFGAPFPDRQKADLDSLAGALVERVAAEGAQIVLAHSVASIIASVAARRPQSPIQTILSLEGNLTAEDAYFSGTAADYASPDAFKPAFLDRLQGLAESDPIIARYRGVVANADPRAMWELGCDAYAFSQKNCPGQWLLTAARSAYLYSPSNLPERSLSWLEDTPLPRFELPGASHWASVDQPELLASKIAEALLNLSK
nr:alpha/beta hydrolase [Hyphomonas sp. Mor2]